MFTVIKLLVRWMLAATFFTAGVLHFTLLREDFAAIVPPPFTPKKDEIVLITGVMEILGGLGLVLPSTTRWAKICLSLFLIAVFPANAYGARNKILFRGQPHTPISIRLPLQVLLIALLWWSQPVPFTQTT